MPITLNRLIDQPEVEKVIIRSLDCALYQAVVVDAGKEQLIVDDNGKPLRGHGMYQLLEELRPIGAKCWVLQHSSAYDEMIGQPPRQGDNRLEVPLYPGEVIPFPTQNRRR
ncbi:DUF6482 family protein [Ferrimonas marina]|uniref:Uncharacterized protein n=1 Tax=Ferrimonas marina TaxID=299255 RepID=A0A1M5NZX7_9GAMM|nr:DUF6482 family protein [Ferrimonas marina]SHG94729.1 hypothetical protein SAMN02745129_1229 [Ferrimonas marina]